MLKESLKACRSQPVSTALSIVIVAAMCLAVLLTTGRSLGVREEVLRSVDTLGSRTVVITAQADAGLNSNVVPLVASLNIVSWAGGFGPATDVTNERVTGAAPVPLRTLWTEDSSVLSIQNGTRNNTDQAYASSESISLLGLADGVGSVIDSRKRSYEVVGGLSVPEPLKFMEPLIANPQPASAEGPLALLVVIADSPANVSLLENLIPDLLVIDDRSKLSISSSSTIAALREVVSGQVDTFSGALVAGVLAVSTTLIGAVMGSLVILRRKDFGRRRALGATRAWIVSLILLQGIWTSILGSCLGVLSAYIALTLTNSPLPMPDAFTSVGTLGVIVGAVASLVPGIIASTRQPLRELRVP